MRRRKYFCSSLPLSCSTTMGSLPCLPSATVTRNSSSESGIRLNPPPCRFQVLEAQLVQRVKVRRARGFNRLNGYGIELHILVFAEDAQFFSHRLKRAVRVVQTA